MSLLEGHIHCPQCSFCQVPVDTCDFFSRKGASGRCFLCKKHITILLAKRFIQGARLNSQQKELDSTLSFFWSTRQWFLALSSVLSGDPLLQRPARSAFLKDTKDSSPLAFAAFWNLLNVENLKGCSRMTLQQWTTTKMPGCHQKPWHRP